MERVRAGLRIPYELNTKLILEARKMGISKNALILQMLKREIDERLSDDEKNQHEEGLSGPVEINGKSISERMTQYGQMIEKGEITINQARKELGLKAIDGGDQLFKIAPQCLAGSSERPTR